MIVYLSYWGIFFGRFFFLWTIMQISAKKEDEPQYFLIILFCLILRILVKTHRFAAGILFIWLGGVIQPWFTSVLPCIQSTNHYLNDIYNMFRCKKEFSVTVCSCDVFLVAASVAKILSAHAKSTTDHGSSAKKQPRNHKVNFQIIPF